MGDGYAIIWVTSFYGTGWVTYKGANGETVTVSDIRNGFLRTNDYIHVVKVAESEYQYLINGYTVHSTEVTGHEFATATFGKTYTYSTRLKNTKPSGNNDVRALVLTDVHGGFDKNGAVEYAQRAYNAFGFYNTFFDEKANADPTLVIFNGDLVGYVDEQRLKLMFEIMGNTTYGQYPIVYCRGNHELRGIDSTRLLDYLPTKTGEFYFDFTYGSLWGVVLDTGEDRQDMHKNNGLLSNYSNYLAKEENWLRTLRKPTDTTIKYRLGIHHIPSLESLGKYAPTPNNTPDGTVQNWYAGVDITDSMAHLDLQFAVAGHEHAYKIYDNSIRPSGILDGMTESEFKNLINAGKVTKKKVTTKGSLKEYEFGGYDVFYNGSTKIKFKTSSLTHKTFVAGGEWNGTAFFTLQCKDNTNQARLFALGAEGQIVGLNDDGSRNNDSATKFATRSNPYIVNFATPQNMAEDKIPEPIADKSATTNQVKLVGPTWNDNGFFETAGSLATPGKNITSKAIIKGTPAVIETGGDWYNVVWITDKKSAGYVQLTYDGTVYLFYDEVGGKRRCNDVVHTVKVPKKYLNNNKYFVVSYLVTHSSDEVATYTSGDYSSSPEYLFEDRSNDKTPNILLYANYKTYTAEVQDMASQLGKKAIEGLSTDFSFVAAAGDLCLEQMGATRDVAVAGNNEEFRDFFISATDLSGGTKLVVISRGNSECRGFYA
ncbi:MAG: metallophosphoesterase, partial [Clostridia bacterium]|nr:metallophosphoesterase [Clostridia bacterium]